MSIGEDRRQESQPQLSNLPAYQLPPLTDFHLVDPSTDLAGLNLSWREIDLPQRLRTKHVHSLHPYLGKFVPQLVEIFLRKFRPSVVYDPFMGSGTTLVEANALGFAAVGCDVSAFNCMVAEVKTGTYDLALLETEIQDILKRALRGAAPLDVALGVADELCSKNADEGVSSPYLAEWYAPASLRQLGQYRALIPRYRYQQVLQLILSRSARSARLTTHFDLDFPSQPQREPYFCHKHRRTCLPTPSADKFLRRYSHDTFHRLSEYAGTRRSSDVRILHADARSVDLLPIDLVLTSPPYVGLIDYHEQHRYAYELLGLPRRDDSEIGAATKGSSKAARAAYRAEMANVFKRTADALVPGGTAVVVVGDRHKLYEGMATEVGLREVLRLQRHVNRRTGRRAGEFFEDILIWRKE